jgi:Zn-dependent protease
MMLILQLLEFMDVAPAMPVLFVLSIVISLTLHEYMHAVSASQFGDKTPEFMGRVTLNPVKHIDPLGAVVFLTLGFGWAKPVPTNPFNYKKISPKIGHGLVALAGPMANVFLAILCALLILGLAVMTGESTELLYPLFDLNLDYLFSTYNPFIVNGVIFLNFMLIVNILTFAFNMIPVPPLDGSKILQSLTLNKYSIKFWEVFQEYGPIILFSLLLLGTLTRGVFNPLILFVDIFSMPINLLIGLII